MNSWTPNWEVQRLQLLNIFRTHLQSNISVSLPPLSSPLPMLFITNVSIPSCTPTLRGRGGGRGGGSELCTNNVSVWERSSDLVIMFYSWTIHLAITVTLFYGFFYNSFIPPVFFLYIVQITKQSSIFNFYFHGVFMVICSSLP